MSMMTHRAGFWAAFTALCITGAALGLARRRRTAV